MSEQDLEVNSKMTDIICSECGVKQVVLFLEGHKFAGIFSCEAENDCGASWECTHPEHHTEQVEVDTFEPVHGHDTYETPVEICDVCETDCTEEVGLPEPPEDDCQDCP